MAAYLYLLLLDAHTSERSIDSVVFNKIIRMDRDAISNHHHSTFQSQYTVNIVFVH